VHPTIACFSWRVISQSKTAVSGYALHRVTARSGVASGEEREAFEYKEVEILEREAFEYKEVEILAIGLGEIFDGLVVEREALEYEEVEILAIELGEIFDELVVEGKGEVLGKLWQPCR